MCRILAAILNVGDIRIEGHIHSYLGEVSTINQMDKIEDGILRITIIIMCLLY